MKRLSAIIATMALTLMLSSVAQANFLGMNSSDSTYKWIYDMNQQITYADGSRVVIDKTNAQTALADIVTKLGDGEEMYLWGFANVTQVQDDSVDPALYAWNQGTDPGTVTAVFWGLKIEAFDGANLLFTGGSTEFYSGASAASGLSSLDLAGTGYMSGGTLDVATLLANEASWNSSGRFDDGIFATFDWAEGVLPGYTQIADTTQGNSETIAQGKYNLSVTSDNNFSELIDSNAYAGESDVEGNGAIKVVLSGGWDFSITSGDAHMTAVPEPSTFLLIGLGMIGCFAYARRRRNNA